MMVETARQGNDPLKIWYTAEEGQIPSSESARWRITMRPHVWRPPTDMYETDEAIVVRVEIAGMRDSEFSISLEDRYLTIRGVRSEVAERRAYHRMEIPFGEFVTEVELPAQVASNEVNAVYRDGFLRVLLPKARPIQVKIEEE